ncbi:MULTISPECIES: hypothetical protein [unclassified Ensifer]|uniref:hypothetical protein n=1 Tax=unclassified Ensifer TaxID=2633371 RepID=UPI00070A1ACF|nr:MULTISPECIES: hypothetical protein [unclassified Ensifer]KQW61041.1 hypothetical protein ASD02_23185 [Ensifer sp. Root1252]KRC77946.1 hypothetical protein ASE32_27795 [Ensifer sp. Root231]KRD00366.1 hypothetical protein ASE47_23755 [Ensifer sp. Root258]
MRFYRVLLIAAFASCIFRGEIASADTADAITELRNTPLSAFDLGLYSLKRDLHERFREQGIEVEMPDKRLRQYETGAGYNPDSGYLTVYAIGFPYPPIPPTWNFASECEQVLTRMRFQLGYDPGAGKLYKEPSIMMDHFLDNFRGQLTGDIAEATRIILIRVVDGRRRECTGRLMSGELQVSD